MQRTTVHLDKPNMLLNRPSIRPITSLDFPAHDYRELQNGMPLFFMRGGTQRVTKMELIMTAGKTSERGPGVAQSTASLLQEGTRHKTGREIADALDYYGATLQSSAGVDMARITLYALTSRIPDILPLVLEIFSEPSFPESELETYRENALQKLQLDLTKNDVLGYRALMSALFGEDHPYGYNMQAENLHALNRQSLRMHHQHRMYRAPFRVFVSGLLDESVVSQIADQFGDLPVHRAHEDLRARPSLHRPIHKSIEGPQPHQASLRIGRQLFTREHPDFPGMYVLNTLLGGFFGSRLMRNIREKRGLTYHIYSSMDSFQHSGYFFVSTDMMPENIDLAREEIYREWEKLQKEPVAADELRMVKNYLMGLLMSQIDGPFNASDILKTCILEFGDTSYFSRLVSTIQSISPEDLMHLAQTYLRRDEMSEILVV